MKGIEWGILYNKYHNQTFDPNKIEDTLTYLNSIYDEEPDGLKKAGFYEYCLSGDRTLIWKRAFSDKQQKQVYEKQNRRCAICKNLFSLHEMEGHHKIPFVDGGETTIDNCVMLCKDCHDDYHAERR